MNKETFYNYIEQPEILDEKSLKDLSELLVDYPYFQTAQMLYAKNLHNINHVKYDAQLKLTSAYIYNRKKLFQLINLKPKVVFERTALAENIEDSNLDEQIVITEESHIEEPISLSEVFDKDNVNNIETTDNSIEEPNVDANSEELLEFNENVDVFQNQTEIAEEISPAENIIEDINLEGKIIESVEESVNIEIIDQVQNAEEPLNEIEHVNEELIIKEPETNIVAEEMNIVYEELDSVVDVSEQVDFELNITNEEAFSSPQIIYEDANDESNLNEKSNDLNSEMSTDNSSNVADEILQRVAKLKQGLSNNKEEKTESIADIILRKSALAKNKKEAENKEPEFKIEENVPLNEYLNIEEKSEVLDDNIESVKDENLVEEELNLKTGIEEVFEQNVDSNTELEINIINDSELEEKDFEANIQDISQKTDTIISESLNKEIILEEQSEDLEKNYIAQDIVEDIDSKKEGENIADDSILEIENQTVNENIVEIEAIETEFTPEIEIKPSETIIIKNENLAFNDWFNVLKGSPVKNQEIQKVDSAKIVSKSELIEKFIKDEPRITPIKNSNIDFKIDISKSAVSESDSFITETLAKIYIKQGYYEKALNIYKKLSLKYSENNTYFAKKIEEVKNLINK